MKQPGNPYSIRMPPDVKLWLAAQAACNGRSIAAEINAMLKDAMKANPIYATVRHVAAGADSFYCVALGGSLEDFFEGKSKREAITAARAKLKEMGFPHARIEFHEETQGVDQ